MQPLRYSELSIQTLRQSDEITTYITHYAILHYRFKLYDSSDENITAYNAQKNIYDNVFLNNSFFVQFLHNGFPGFRSDLPWSVFVPDFPVSRTNSCMFLFCIVNGNSANCIIYLFSCFSVFNKRPVVGNRKQVRQTSLSQNLPPLQSYAFQTKIHLFSIT